MHVLLTKERSIQGSSCIKYPRVESVDSDMQKHA